MRNSFFPERYAECSHQIESDQRLDAYPTAIEAVFSTIPHTDIFFQQILVATKVLRVALHTMDQTLIDCSLNTIDVGNNQQFALSSPLSAPDSIPSWHATTRMSTEKSSVCVKDPSKASYESSVESTTPEAVTEAQGIRLATQKNIRTRSFTSDVGGFRCWEHQCNGRSFTTRGNLVRHCVERSEARRTYACARCGAKFSRLTARNQHITKKRCGRRPTIDYSST